MNSFQFQAGSMRFIFIILINVVSVAAVILFFNFGLGAWDTWHPQDSAVLSGTYVNQLNYFQDHPWLGYAPRKGISVSSRKASKSRVIYETIYTIDSRGHRKHPDRRSKPKNAVLFYGDSYMFGEGVKDEETIPFRFEIHSNMNFQAFNFGFHGYGPHQMLVHLEQNLAKDDLVSLNVRHAVYLAIPPHGARALFQTAEALKGPEYKIEKGELHYTGQRQPTPQPFLRRVLSGSPLAQHLNLLDSHDQENLGLDMFLALVKKSAQLVSEKYHADFTLILWGFSHAEHIREQLRAPNVRVVTIEEIISDINQAGGHLRYSILGDGHPNALADDRIAAWLARELR